MKNTKLQNPSLRKRKGFTLIELIVVIAILAILAAIAIPTFLGTLTKARNRADIASARVIVSAFQVALAEGNPVASIDTVGELVTANYLDKAPVPQTKSTGTPAFSMTVSGNEVTQVVDQTGQVWYPAPTADVAIA